MGDVKSLEQLNLVAAFVVPGLVAMFVRAQFLHGRVTASKDAILGLFALSLVWYGLTAPFLPLLGTVQRSLQMQIAIWFSWTILGPALFGLLLGLNASRGWLQRILRRLGLRPVHAQPTAWDWKFQRMRAPEWVILVLKDGTTFGGFCGPGSFISSDPKERDIYVERIYRIAEDGKWEPQGDKGLLVLHGELRSIEFFPYIEQEASHA